MRNTFFWGLIFLALSTTTYAETTSDESDLINTNTFYFSAGRVNIDSEIAFEERVDDAATYIRLAWEGQRQGLIYGAGLSGFFYSDNDGFSQRVEDSFGDESTRGSNADAFSLFGEIGYGLKTTEFMYLDLLAGYELVISSERGIDNCTDCYSEDIDIDSGAYITPRLRFIADNGFTFALTYQNYFGGDIENGYTLMFGYTY